MLEAASQSKISYLQLLLIFVLLGVVYAPVITPMVAQWYNDPNYSHGFLVPLVSLWFLREKRLEIIKTRIMPDSRGFFLFLFGLFLLVSGYAAVEYFTMRLSLVVVVAGIVYYWYGSALLKVLSLPIGYLVFMIPLPYILYDTLAFPLKLFVARYSVAILKVFGVVVWREGNIIQFPLIALQVADACSGLRSLMSLFALAVALAFLAHKSVWKKCLLVVAAGPIAVLANLGRVVITGLLAQNYGSAAAEGFFHEFAGLTVFFFAMILLGLFSYLLRRAPG